MSETHSYNTGEEPERKSAGIVERHTRQGHIKHPPSDRAYFVLEGTSYFGDEEGWEETKLVDRNDVSIIPEGTVYNYEEHISPFLSHSLGFEQGSNAHHDNPWG